MIASSPTASMMPSLRTRAVRALAAAVGAVALAAAPAAAQTITVGFDPACGATPCEQIVFTVTNPGTTQLEIGFLRFIGASSEFAFADFGGAALFGGTDSLSPLGFSVLGTLQDGGTTAAIDFLSTDNGATPFTLDAGAVGTLSTTLAAVPTLTGQSFRFDGRLADQTAISGTIALTGATSVVPEPATVALTGAGLALVGAFARRRRAA